MSARCRPRAGLLEFQLNAKIRGPPGLAIFVSQFSKSVAEKIHGVTTRAKLAENH
jgi:hypothetical protein